jgi:hypothetical protein
MQHDAATRLQKRLFQRSGRKNLATGSIRCNPVAMR